MSMFILPTNRFELRVLEENTIIIERGKRKYVFKKSNYLTERKTEVREIYVNVNIEK